MNKRLQVRVDELRVEFERGNARLNELQAEESQLRETMLRIQGAITVLQELLVDHPDDQPDTVVELDQHRQG